MGPIFSFRHRLTTFIPRTSSRGFWIVALLVLATRVPFLDAGYGTDPDSLRIASAAEQIASTHEYSASRFPGYPLHEIVCALLPWKRPVALNGLSAVASAFAAGFFFLSLATYNRATASWGTAAFVLTPVVFIASVTTIDYMPALCCILAATLCVTKGRFTLAGVLIGAAIGFRPSSSIVLIPFFFVVRRSANLTAALQIIGSAMLVGVLAFLPVWFRYGIDSFRPAFYRYPSLGTIAKHLTIDTWGIVGSCSVAVAAFSMMRGWGRKEGVQSKQILITLSGGLFGIELALFALMPLDAGYLIPAIPFAIILAGTGLSSKQFRNLCAGICLSGFVLGIDSADRPWSVRPSSVGVVKSIGSRSVFVDALEGPVVLDHQRRLQQIRFADTLVAFARSRHRPTVFVAGVWQLMIARRAGAILEHEELGRPAFALSSTSVVGLLTKEELSSILARNDDLYFVHSQDEYNLEVFGVDLRSAAGIRLPGEE